MPARLEDSVAITINRVLRDLPSVRSKQCIYEVPKHLREVNPKAYEPEIVSLGPYHHGKSHLQEMEEHKIRYLQLLLHRRGEDSVDRYVEFLRKEEPRARKCYAELATITQDKFVEMMLLDGFFIIELIRKAKMSNLRDANDRIFKMKMLLYSLKHDLFLLENQLPFFILWKLFSMTMMPDEENEFIQMIFYFLDVLPGGGNSRGGDISPRTVKHLLGLIHDNWLPSPLPSPDAGQSNSTNEREDIELLKHCATELKEAGIKFRKADGANLFDIKFEKGTLKIPTINLQDNTEAVLRNLIAYEQFSHDGENSYQVTDYIIFMDHLINTAADVELLYKRDIIDHQLGDNDMIATLFNSLGKNVALNYDRSYYSEVSHSVNVHCRKRWHRRLAKLRHDYFSSPWALISVIAASMLLAFTITQTAYTVLSYYKGQSPSPGN